jgi:hypothetical protein
MLLCVTLAFGLTAGRSPEAFAAGARGLPLAQAQASQPSAQTTLYLPLVMRSFDPGYVSPFGIVMYDGVDAAAGINQMQAAGSRWVTTFFHWNSVEPNAPVGGVHLYDWSILDTKVNNAAAAGMQVYVLFSGNPSWAAQYVGGPVYPEHVQDLVAFVTAMAERYNGDGVNDAPGSPVVNYWSFYAEPDNGSLALAAGGWGIWGHNGAGYAAMLSQVSPAIHSANPGAKVLIGGIAYDNFEENGGYFVRSFLSDTLQTLNTPPYSGAVNYIDAVAFHFYPINPGEWPTIRDKALNIRNILSQHGVGQLPLIAPEVGFYSAPALGPNETAQAQAVVQTYVRGLSVGIVQISWYLVFDGTTNTGLFRGTNLSAPKPSYFAYQTMTRELDGARYVRDLSVGGAEGYVFRTREGTEKTVVWGNPASAQVPFAGSCLRVVDLLGGVTQVIDGGAGDLDALNGQVRLQVTANQPLYAGPC